MRYADMEVTPCYELLSLLSLLSLFTKFTLLDFYTALQTILNSFATKKLSIQILLWLCSFMRF